jgi:pilus assembly protein CpaE
VIQQQVIAVGTPQTFRSALARALEVELDAVGWVQSVVAAEEMLADSDHPAHVLVLSPEVREPDALGLAEFVGRMAPMTAVIVAREKSLNGMLPAAMRAGIRDVVDLTRGTEEMRDAVERAIVWTENVSSATGRRAATAPKHRGSVISVFASKGGVGKTFLTTNLAGAFADLSKQDTAVVDLDVNMGDVFSYFGREPVKEMADLLTMGEGAERETVFANGVKLDEHLWGFGALPDPSASPPSGEAVGKMLRVLRENFAFVVVDASAAYTDLALATFDLSEAICLVAMLDVVGVKHLSKALETLLTIGVPRERFRIVLNRADSRVGLDAADVERVMKIQVDAMIPSSRLVPTCLNKGRPVVLEVPNADVSDSIFRFASRFVAPIAKDGELQLTQVPAEGKRRLFKR